MFTSSTSKNYFISSSLICTFNNILFMSLRMQICIQIIWLIILFQRFLATMAKEFYTLSICHLDRTKCPIKHDILRICRHHSERRDGIIMLSHILWTAARQTPLSRGFPRQEYWIGLPFPPPRGSSWPRDQIRVSCIAGEFFTVWATTEPLRHFIMSFIIGTHGV